MTTTMICTTCKIEMNHHCDKLVYGSQDAESLEGGSIEEFHSCPACGCTASRPE